MKTLTLKKNVGVDACCPKSRKGTQNSFLRLSSDSEKKANVTPPISACSKQPSCKRQQRREVT